MTETMPKRRPSRAKAAAQQVVAVPESTRPPYGHPDYEFPKEVHNLLVTAQSAHVNLSQMADSKASILMGATFVVFSITLGQITSTKISISLLILAGSSLLATIFSVFAIRPKLPPPSKAIHQKTNLVFFGSFAGIPEEKYIDHVIDILKSEEATYRTMARDLYQNGHVLYAKKYRYLTYAYTTFLIGIVATAATFLWELLTHRI